MQSATPLPHSPLSRRTGVNKRFKPDYELSTKPEKVSSRERLRRMSAYDLAGYHARQADSQARVRVKNAVRNTDAYKAATLEVQRQMEMDAVGREMERRDVKGRSATKKLAKDRTAFEALYTRLTGNTQGPRVNGGQGLADSKNASRRAPHDPTDLLSDDEGRVAEKGDINKKPERSGGTDWGGTGAVNMDIDCDSDDSVDGENTLTAFENKIVVERARIERKNQERGQHQGKPMEVGDQHESKTPEKHKEEETEKMTEKNPEKEEEGKQGQDRKRPQREEQEQTAALDVRIRALIDAARELVEESRILAEKWGCDIVARADIFSSRASSGISSTPSSSGRSSPACGDLKFF